MKTRRFTLLTLLLVGVMLVGGVPLVRAQNPLPAIVTFTSSLESITVADAEAGAQTTTLEWYTAGMTEDYRVMLHSYRGHDWELVFGEDSVPLEANGSRVVTVHHPQNFGPPTYLLSIVDGSSRVIDQRTLSIPYDVADLEGPPGIETFAADAEGVDLNALVAGTATLFVTWDVANRVPTSNLSFEQVFADGTSASVELPRENLWVPSAGQGPVAPAFREGMEAVTLRLRVADVVAGTIYAEETLTLPVVNVSVPPVTATPPPSTAVPGAMIESFSAEPEVVNPGAAVTLAWDVRGTGGVTIEQQVPGIRTPEMVVNARSPQGSATVYLPDYAAYSVTFMLTTSDGGNTAFTTVGINCPYTFFFGAGDGCPASPAVEIQAAYEPFEGGYMVWRGDTRDIFVHYEDGTAEVYADANYSVLPGPGAEVPPLDRVVPSGGFGRVWAGHQSVRDRLGWALEPEESYTMTLQQVAPTRDPRPQFEYYLTLPNETVIGTGYGTWQVIE